jgi:hypothetical protein
MIPLAVKFIVVPIVAIIAILFLRAGWDYMRPKENDLEDVLQCGKFFIGMVLLVGEIVLIAL